jgi:hypothetical protein
VPKSSVITQEFQAIQTALEALEPLDPVQRQFAVSMILSRLGIGGTPGAAPGTEAPAPVAAGAASAGTTGLGGIGVKEFLKQKAPTTELERLVCLAYYLTHSMNISSFMTKEIKKLNTEAHGMDFSNAAATATNAVRQSKFLSGASGGKKRITTRGEAVVEAMPDRAKVKEVLAVSQRSGKRRRGPKKSKAAK